MENSVDQRKSSKPSEWWPVILDLTSVIIAITSLAVQLLR